MSRIDIRRSISQPIDLLTQLRIQAAYVLSSDSVTVFKSSPKKYSSFPGLYLLHLLTNTLPSASEVTTLWCYTNMCIIIIITLIIISFSSPTFSFIPDLKPSFSANPSHCSLSFSTSELTTWFLRLLLLLLTYLVLLFSLFLFYNLVVSVRKLLNRPMSAFERTLK